MWSWAAVSIAFALLSSALRPENGRFELEALQDKEPEFPLRSPNVFVNLQLSASAEAASVALKPLEHLEEPVELTSYSCTDGVLFLKGTMVLKEKFVFSKDCETLRGENGSQVILEAPLQFKGDLRLEGDLRFKATSAFERACLTIRGKASVHGDLRIEDCHNQGDMRVGGGLDVWRHLTQLGGTIKVTNCSSGYHGGGMYVWEGVTQHGGTIKVTNCSSRDHGGGMYVWEGVTQHDGTIEVTDCSSEKDGGGLFVDDIKQHGGDMKFSGCSSGRDGGGMFVDKNYFHLDANVVFAQCTAESDGGGLFVGHFQQDVIRNSTAAAPPFLFKACSADRGGGMSAATVNATQPMLFQWCQATQSGGGIRMAGKLGVSALESARFEKCSAPQATAIEARELSIGDIELVDTFEQAITATSLNISKLNFVMNQTAASGNTLEVSIKSDKLRIDSELDCSKVRECHLLVPHTSPPNTSTFRCSRGTGVGQSPAFGCWACPEGLTQVENVTNSSCLPCPEGALVCENGKIQMKTGLMVHETNVSRPLHCPAKAACRHGEIPRNAAQPMCQKGYSGKGCAKCAMDPDTDTLYLTGDSSVFTCTPCANATLSQIFQWTSFVLQKSALFAISAASIFGAGRADRVKNSGVYINQLMAFAAVSSSVITTVLQTETARTMKNEAVNFLYNTAAFMSEAGSGQGVRSSHCLLSYLSLESSGLWGVHCLDVAVAALLVLLLSLKDFRVALVAGLNCFLPNILADFTKYAVCYKLEEDAQGGGLICNHLPFSNVSGFAVVSLGFLAVFAISLWVWIRLSTSRAATKEDELPSHVAFLTNKYAEGRQYFEAERLVRKVLLTSAAAYFPSTTYPELQMMAQAVITSGSMFLYGVFHPYTQPDWNWNELRLSLTALLLIYLTSTVMANEEQWDKTERAQQLMIISLGVVVTAVCSAFVIKIALEVWRERRPQRAA